MWEYPVNSPSKVSNYPESIVPVTLLIPLDVRFRGYLTTGHSPSMGIGEGPKNPASMSIYSRNVLESYPTRNTLGEACKKPTSPKFATMTAQVTHSADTCIQTRTVSSMNSLSGDLRGARASCDLRIQGPSAVLMEPLRATSQCGQAAASEALSKAHSTRRAT